MTTNTSSNPLSTTPIILASIGAINWGLVGAFNFNLVTYLLGESTAATKAVYIGVGLSGLYLLFTAVMSLANPSTINIK